MREIVEQIEALDLKATEWRVAMRLLHQADANGRVQMSREACILLCGVNVWGAASRLLCKLAGHSLIGWYSDAGGVLVYFPQWPRADSARPEPPPPPPPPVDLAGLLQALTQQTRQNGALLTLLTELARQIGALVQAGLGEQMGDAPNPRGTRQNGAPLEPEQADAPSAADADEPTTRQNGAERAEAARIARQIGALCAQEWRETRQIGAAMAPGARQIGAFSHTGARAHSLSVCLSDPLSSDLKPTDRQTDQATGSLARANAGFSQENECPSGNLAVQAQPEGSGPIPPVAPAPLPAGIEPELALGLLRDRAVNLPQRDAQAVATAYPFWQIRDCVFHFVHGRDGGEFRSPRIMLTWLAEWDEWMIPPVSEADQASELFQRYLLPAERQAQAEEERRRAAWLAEAEAAQAEDQRPERAETSHVGVPAADATAAETAAWQTVLDDVRLGLPNPRALDGVRLVRVAGDTWFVQADSWVQARLGHKLERALRTIQAGAQLQWMEVER